MPIVIADGLTLNYEQRGTGQPLILIPYLAAAHACYAFQMAEYARHFTCMSLDLRGTGESDEPPGAYTTELLADDVAAFMQAAGIGKAHVAGLSLGGAIGMWLAARYPDRVQSWRCTAAGRRATPSSERSSRVGRSSRRLSAFRT
jgi:3-oxoadipate enol-lactonase